MRPLEKVYWLRLVLGVVAALACAGYLMATHGFPQIKDPTHVTDWSIFDWNIGVFFNSASIAIIIYLLSYYFVKFKFQSVVQKPQKLITTGIGVYLLSWIALWILLYTLVVNYA